MLKTAGEKIILADGRWNGMHGIGRFSQEVLARLTHTEILISGPNPLSIQNLFWQSFQLIKHRDKKIFFTPGFNPVIYSPIPFVITIHDLIHLKFPEESSWFKKIYYEFLIKPSLHRAKKIITASEYSKKTILEWVNIPAEKIIVAGNGVSHHFTTQGQKYSPGFSYFFYAGNTKPHKNIVRLIKAFARAKINSDIRLILTGEKTAEISALLQQTQLADRVIFCGKLSEELLANYYRGALALLFPSLYEGFGLPVVEAMACGTPVLTSNVTSLPEIAGSAALLVDPYNVENISLGIEQMAQDENLRNTFIAKGLERAKLFSWDNTTRKIQEALL